MHILNYHCGRQFCMHFVKYGAFVSKGTRFIRSKITTNTKKNKVYLTKNVSHILKSDTHSFDQHDHCLWHQIHQKAIHFFVMNSEPVFDK